MLVKVPKRILITFKSTQTNKQKELLVWGGAHRILAVCLRPWVQFSITKKTKNQQVQLYFFKKIINMSVYAMCFWVELEFWDSRCSTRWLWTCDPLVLASQTVGHHIWLNICCFAPCISQLIIYWCDHFILDIQINFLLKLSCIIFCSVAIWNSLS